MNVVMACALSVGWFMLAVGSVLGQEQPARNAWGRFETVEEVAGFKIPLVPGVEKAVSGVEQPDGHAHGEDGR